MHVSNHSKGGEIHWRSELKYPQCRSTERLLCCFLFFPSQSAWHQWGHTEETNETNFGQIETRWLATFSRHRGKGTSHPTILDKEQFKKYFQGKKKLLISNSKYSMIFCWLDKYIRNNKFRISNLWC